MKQITLFLILFGLIVFSCAEKQNNTQLLDRSDEMNSQAHVAVVTEKIDAGSYSYLNVTENGNNYWIAIPKSDLTAGEEIFFSQFMEMKNFRSETLNRTFESVLFVEDARKNNQQDMANPHKVGLESIQKESLSIDKAEGGYTIAELFERKDELANTTVKVRGKVVKANLGIMKRNWFHIQDGTGEQGSHDLTFTTNDEAQIGETIIVEGTLVKDKDFGSGYFYPLILENARISKK